MFVPPQFGFNTVHQTLAVSNRVTVGTGARCGKEPVISLEMSRIDGLASIVVTTRLMLVDTVTGRLMNTAA